jgi:hypothetical protein
VKIIRNGCIYRYIYIDTHEHTSIYCNGSVKTTRCVCVWVYMRFVLRTQAWQCINDKILEGTKHTYTLPLSLERNKNSYRTLYDCVVCVHRAEFLFSFLSLQFSLSLRCCLYGNNKRWREEVLYSVYYLVGWFFFRVIIFSTLHRYLLAFFFLFSRPGSSTSDREKEEAIQ